MSRCRKHWKECGLFSTDWEKVEEIHKAYGEKRSWPDSSVREKSGELNRGKRHLPTFIRLWLRS